MTPTSTPTPTPTSTPTSTPTHPWRSLPALSLAACALACASGRPAQSASSLAPSKIETPDGVTLASACTPTGPELCFNASDDNCNGVVDEGCGVGTGPLQFAIAWSDNAADVDLAVTDPRGCIVGEGKKDVCESGMRRDRACGGKNDTCNGQSTENVFLEGLDPLPGRYVVEIHLAEANGARLPVAVHFAARVGSRAWEADVSLGAGDTADRSDKRTFTFELPGAPR